MTVRPKEIGTYIFPVLTENARCVIDCAPQQRWEAQELDNESVMIYRGNVTMHIPKDIYEKHWKEVPVNE